LAAYGVEDSDFAITQLAQTTMRSEIGKLTLDRTLTERTVLNHNIVVAINEAAINWSIECIRYEIRNIHPPVSVVRSMHTLVSAERQKRAEILQSEGERQAAINKAEGEKEATILRSESEKIQKINIAEGEAAAILTRANATSQSVEFISRSIRDHGADAVSMIIAQKYMEAFTKLAKKSTTFVFPSNMNDPASLVTKALSLYQKIDLPKK